MPRSRYFTDVYFVEVAQIIWKLPVDKLGHWVNYSRQQQQLANSGEQSAYLSSVNLCGLLPFLNGSHHVFDPRTWLRFQIKTELKSIAGERYQRRLYQYGRLLPPPADVWSGRATFTGSDRSIKNRRDRIRKLIRIAR
ncbi:MAG TPA: hypothetical protein VEF04_20805, partial [Blastocatellia bacterium]|nr:hypothetical protein [Blastocatellia bacterium]